MCRSRLWLLYWVSTQIRRQPAFTRFDSAKSISRYRPPNGTAGLARSAVSGASRLPAPPASTMPRTRNSAISHLLRSAVAAATWLAGHCHADLGLGVSGGIPVSHESRLKAMLGGERDQGLGPVVEVLMQHVMLGPLGPVEGEVEEPARRQDPADVGQALIDHLDRGVREHAVRVREVEHRVGQEMQPQILD